MNTDVMFSSKTEMWETPQDFFDKLIVSETKQCSKCGKILPLSEFPHDRSKASGYASQCKLCRNDSKRRSRKKALKIPDCCPGCTYYRSHSSSGDGVLMGCHYLIDTGHSRLKECGKGVCTVRKERKIYDAELKNNNFLF